MEVPGPGLAKHLQQSHGIEMGSGLALPFVRRVRWSRLAMKVYSRDSPSGQSLIGICPTLSCHLFEGLNGLGKKNCVG